MAFREAIQEIIEAIPSGTTFDSHFIIDRLIKSNSDEYINFTSTFANPENSTLPAHGNIGQVIAEFERQGLIRRQNNQSWSKNIHGKASRCALWERI